MSFRLYENDLFIRSKSTGELVPIGMVASGADASLLEIAEYAEQKTVTTKTQIDADAKAARDSIPPVYTDLSNTVSRITSNLNFPTLIGLEVGDFDHSTDITSDVARNDRGRSIVFTINEPTVIIPQTDSFTYHVLCQKGDTVSTITPRYMTVPFTVSDTDASYRILVRNPSGSGQVAIDPSTKYFSLQPSSYIVQRVEHLEAIVDDFGSPGITTEKTFIDSVKADIGPTDFVFVLTADSHYDELREDCAYQKIYAKKITEIALRVGASAVVCLGDTSNSDYEDIPSGSSYDISVNKRRFSEMIDAFLNRKMPFLYAIGHHELFPNLGLVNGEASYAVDKSWVCKTAHRSLGLDAHYLNDDIGNPNYYVDIPDKSVRLIFLDGVSVTNTGYSWSTINFLSSALSNVPSGYRVACFSHTPTRARANANGTNVPGGNTDLDGDRGQLPSGVSREDATNKNIEYLINQFISTGGRFIGFFHGHVHIDNVVKETIDDNVMQFSLIAECCQRVSSVTTSAFNAIVAGGANKKRWLNRTNYSDTAYCFDVVIVKDSTIKMHRYGIGDDRTITY